MAVAAVLVPRFAARLGAAVALATALLASAPRSVDAAPIELPRTPTPMKQEDLGRLLRESHRQIFGVAPGPERLVGAWAHVALETARGAQCFDHNLGNLTVTLDWRGPFSVLRVLERAPRRPGEWTEQAIRFRAYPTAMDGAVDYWRVMSSRFASVLARFDEGDALGAGRRLCESGYSTAECGGYAGGLASLYAGLRGRFMHRLAWLDTPPSPVAMTQRDWEEIERASALPACVLETTER